MKTNFNTDNSIILCSLSLALTACATTGNQRIGGMDEGQLSNTSKTLKNKDEALRLLGQPDNIDFDTNGNEKWMYEYTHRVSKVQNFIPVVSLFSQGTNDLHKKVILVFNAQGSVLHAASLQSHGETKAGLAE